MVTKNAPQQLLWHGSKLVDQVMRCVYCHSIVLEVRDGNILIWDRHNGRRHENVIRVAQPLDRKA